MVSCVPGSSPKIATIEQWTNAFILFTNIYVGAHPNNIHQLLKYLHSIRLGASRISGQGWKLYDEQFRLKEASNPASSYGGGGGGEGEGREREREEIDTELWLLYMLPSQSTPVSQASKFGPKGRCYDFNFRGSCNRVACMYSHNCTRCGGNHSQTSCNKEMQAFGPSATGPYNGGQSFRPATTNSRFSTVRGGGNSHWHFGGFYELGKLLFVA